MSAYFVSGAGEGRLDSDDRLAIMERQLKYLCLIPDGVADQPCDALGGRTPLEAAEIPTIRRWAGAGLTGRARNVPSGFPPGSDVAIMSILGLDPALYFTGRAPLEAAAMGIELAENQVAYRCNLVTVEDGVMKDFSAGHITTESARPLIGAIDDVLGGGEISFVPGVGYRHICIVPEELGEAECVPPHDLTDKAIVLPSGPASAKLIELMDASKDVLAEADPSGKATQIWLWGQGKQPSTPTFEDRYGMTGAIITAVDLVRGLGVLAHLEVIDVPGATGYYDTDYSAKAEHALEALDRFDFCLVHVEATDEAGHEGRLDLKLEALENFDSKICARLNEALDGEEYRVLLLPDHPTPVATKTHTDDPVPYLIYDSTADGPGGDFTEVGTAGSDPIAGHELLSNLFTNG
ncbi:MAG: cofactor-independent phosphoglycerate mutase [Acidobacteria bacterium]|nr:MAG: cofactor-independent phosphoglycerate mutase [Acidobacteriota bacterium]